MHNYQTSLGCSSLPNPHPQNPGFSSFHLKGEKGKWGGSRIWLCLGDGLDHRLQERLFKGQHWYLEKIFIFLRGISIFISRRKRPSAGLVKSLIKREPSLRSPLHDNARGATLDIQACNYTRYTIWKYKCVLVWELWMIRPMEVCLSLSISFLAP